jgi:hypothetical protein
VRGGKQAEGSNHGDLHIMHGTSGKRETDECSNTRQRSQAKFSARSKTVKLRELSDRMRTIRVREGRQVKVALTCNCNL